METLGAADTAARQIHVVQPRLTPRELRAGGNLMPYEAIVVNPVSPLIGAEVRSVDLSKPLTDKVVAQLKRALLDWKVLFFRNQELTARQHLDFARNWGQPDANPHLPKADIDEVECLEHDANRPGNENIWHNDASFLSEPPLGAILRAIDLPALGGDTLWADMAAAHDGLPNDVKERIASLRAVHEMPAPTGSVAVLLKSINAKAGRRPVEHPVVRTHPETGRKTLYVNAAFTSRIVDLPEKESRELLDLLFQQAQHPEYQVRFRWEKGSIALWDNRATVHYGVNDYYPHYRRMERVAIAGDRPF